MRGVALVAQPERIAIRKLDSNRRSGWHHESVNLEGVAGVQGFDQPATDTRQAWLLARRLPQGSRSFNRGWHSLVVEPYRTQAQGCGVVTKKGPTLRTFGSGQS